MGGFLRGQGKLNFFVLSTSALVWLSKLPANKQFCRRLCSVRIWINYGWFCCAQLCGFEGRSPGLMWIFQPEIFSFVPFCLDPLVHTGATKVLGSAKPFSAFQISTILAKPPTKTNTSFHFSHSEVPSRRIWTPCILSHSIVILFAFINHSTFPYILYLSIRL